MKKQKLNLGCGEDYRKEWINLDNDKNLRVDVFHDITQILPFKDNTFDEVLCSHVLEHIGDTFKLIAEIRRVCKNDAKVIFHIPHWSNFTAYGTMFHKHYYSHLIYREFYGYKIKKISFNCYRRNKNPVLIALKPIINFLNNINLTFTELLLCRFLPVAEVIMEFEVVK